ncbi:phosphomannomutase/phosphoglucomutase [Simiduia litorea]|uniref:phosphomannomutase/phosphoglucomutase n=1 Tax=Simiduia litorea TaxID=1435348 RepID=UPI0036F1A1A1
MSAEQKPKSASPKKPKQTPYFLIFTLASLLLTAILGWVGFQQFVVQSEANTLRTLADVELKKRVGAVEQWIKSLQVDVAQFGERDTLATAVAYQDENVIADYRRAVDKSIQGVKHIDFFPRGSADLNQDAQFPINFVQMDLIFTAESRQTLLPEAVRIDSEWFIQIATGLPTDPASPALGTMLVTLGTEALRELLKNQDQQLGQTTVKQVFGKSVSSTFLSSGVGESELTLTEDIPGSNWQVEFIPSYALMKRAAISPIPFLGGCIVVFLALVFTSAFASRKLIAHQAVQKAHKAREKAMMTAKPSQEKGALDVEVKEEDKKLLGSKEKSLAQSAEKKSTQVAVDDPEDNSALKKIFRAYDIRGVVGEQLTPAFAETLGKALGSEAIELGESTLLVGRDGRVHSEELSINLINGILSTGCNVINIGLVPSPVLYFACATIGSTKSGIVVTASHNSGEYNGFKMVLNGNTLTADAINAIYTRIQRAQFRTGSGVEQIEDVCADYIDRIFSDVALAGDVKLVIDAANGATSVIAPQLFEELGCEVEPLFCEVDGRFPNHQPDPSRPENLNALIAKVKSSGADLGVAFDGDGDRLTIVTPKGQIIWPDRLLMLFAKDIVSRNPGADVLFDVKSTRQLNSLITSYGGRPIMWKTGHSNMKQKMLETGALLGGELSGHIFIKDRWFGFDDALYATARLLEIMTLRDQDIDSIFEAFPVLPSTPEILLPYAEDKKFVLINKLIADGNFQSGKITTIDGLRVDFAKGWGLVRASNTTPALTLRFEADSEETIEQLKGLFKREIAKIDPSLALDF